MKTDMFKAKMPFALVTHVCVISVNKFRVICGLTNLSFYIKESFSWSDEFQTKVSNLEKTLII